MSKFNVTDCCSKHRDRKIEIKNREHALATLRAEGHKRVESFPFETIFDQNLSGDISSSSGWMFQYSDDDVPVHWFRLVTEASPWKENCDGRLLSFLRDQNLEVIRIFLSEDNTSFLADRREGGRWTGTRALDEVLADLVGRKNPRTQPRNYSSIDYERQALAREQIAERFDTPELTHLCAQRLLVNCYLWPWYYGQPMDIDGVVVSEDGFRLVEFKRKYPTQRGTFGIDQHPHGVLIDWLESYGRPLLHVLLVDPLWRKGESPLHLLQEDSSTSEYASWLGVELSSGAFVEGGGFQTRGSDSGMFGGRRSQREIDPEATALLGEGLQPSRMVSFLKNPAQIPTRNLIDYMRDRRDRAREVYDS